MSNYLVVPMNENGIIVDRNYSDSIGTLFNTGTFGFTDVFLYSHGWWTNSVRAMSDYGRFQIEFAAMIISLARSRVQLGFPQNSLGIGVNWPSMLSQDNGAIENFFQALSFYTMEKRADTVGENGVYAILRSILLSSRPPARLHLIGHSFGCKVLCSALQEVFEDRKVVRVPDELQVNLVLIQGALDNDDLAPEEIYGDILKGFPNIRVLITTSKLDKALHKAYPAAQAINLFRGDNSRFALGAAGPTAAVSDLLGGSTKVDVTQGFQANLVPKETRLVVADLTDVHKVSAQSRNFKPDTLSGHHSDIFQPEIYTLLAGFLFPANAATAS